MMVAAIDGLRRAGVNEGIMQAALPRWKRAARRGVLYPILVITAVSVIIFSALGAAVLAGWLPGSESARTQSRSSGKRSEYIQPESGVAIAQLAVTANRMDSCASS